MARRRSVSTGIALAAMLYAFSPLSERGVDPDPEAVLLSATDPDASEESRGSALRTWRRLVARAADDCARAVVGILDRAVGDPARAGLLGGVLRSTIGAATREVRGVAASDPAPPRRIAAIRVLAAAEDLGAADLLRDLADRDPCLAVRREAVLALAELGDSSLLRDLAALLAETHPEDVRARAGRALWIFTDRDFGVDASRAHRYLDSIGARASTSVGGGGSTPLAARAGGGATLAARDASIILAVRGELERAWNAVLEFESGSVVVEIDPAAAKARAVDVPDRGDPCVRYERLTVVRDRDGVRVELPREGKLANEALRAFTLVGETTRKA